MTIRTVKSSATTNEEETTVFIEGGYELSEREKIVLPNKLNDIIINSSQAPLRNQFPSLKGLINSLLLSKHPPTLY